MNDYNEDALFELFANMAIQEEKERQRDKSYAIQFEKAYKNNFYVVSDEIDLPDYYDYMDYVESIIDTIRDQKEYGEDSFLDCCCAYMSQGTLIRAEIAHFSNKETEEALKDMGMEFLALLSYYLYHRSDNDVEKENNVVLAFKEIVSANEVCSRHYLKIQQMYKNRELYISLPPSSYFNCPIIMSVLMEFNDPSIARKVKKILIENSDTDFRNLAKVNKEHIKEYSSWIGKRNEDSLHDMAIAFVLNYLKDREFVASYCAFVQYGNMIIDEILCYCYAKKDGEIKKALETGHTNFKEVKEAIEIYENALVYAKKDTSELRELLMGYSHIFEHKNKTKSLFLKEDSLEILMQEHKEEIINCIYRSRITFSDVFHPRKDNGFKDLDINTQLLIMSVWCDISQLVDMIDSSRYYTSSIQDLNIRKTLLELEQKDKEKDLVIDEALKTIEKTTKQIDRLEIKYQDKNKQEINKLETIHKKETSKLNKQIKELEKKISELEQNQSELYKLRELMFDMKQEEDVKLEKHASLNEILEKNNVVFVGGFSGFHRKLKERFPKLILVHPDQEKIDLSIIRNADYLFFFTQYIGHSIYYRVVNVANANKIKWDYVHFHNLDILEQEIVQKIEKMKEGTK